MGNASSQMLDSIVQGSNCTFTSLSTYHRFVARDPEELNCADTPGEQSTKMKSIDCGNGL